MTEEEISTLSHWTDVHLNIRICEQTKPIICLMLLRNVKNYVRLNNELNGHHDMAVCRVIKDAVCQGCKIISAFHNVYVLQP
jgi:hypothetical protein